MLEETRLEIPGEILEELLAQGRAKRIGFDESDKLTWQRGGMRRLVAARVKYQAVDRKGESVIETTPMPTELMPGASGPRLCWAARLGSSSAATTMRRAPPAS